MDIDTMKKYAFDLIDNIKSLKEFNDIKTKLLGKKSQINALMRSLKDIDPSQRHVFGEKINNLKTQVQNKLQEIQSDLYAREQRLIFESEKIDISLPGRINNLGRLHPLSTVLYEIQDIFISMGYQVIEAHDIETTYFNFDALNIPENHPARDEQDTFYISDNQVLVTATSPMQIRIMQEQRLPIKIISPGCVYRSDEIDATHTPMFHQIEGLVVDKNITMSDLRGTLDVFAKKLFGDGIKTRFRPHYFPFTEPSAEMDVSCFICNGVGCKTCKHTGFIELLGCGMVHPKVLKNVDINPDEFSGFAFGMGLDRLTMLKFNIDDIRLFYENDIRFLSQF